jgi:hypothetical protein
MSIISWGRREKVTFSSCGVLDSWIPPAIPALFAVTYQRDPKNKPKGHTVLFFGESENMARHASSIKSKMRELWSRNGGTPEDLFLFVRSMDDSTSEERLKVVEGLILEYQPQVNKLASE